jgi:hypothetical protein
MALVFSAEDRSEAAAALGRFARKLERCAVTENGSDVRGWQRIAELAEATAKPAIACQPVVSALAQEAGRAMADAARRMLDAGAGDAASWAQILVMAQRLAGQL